MALLAEYALTPMYLTRPRIPTTKSTGFVCST